MQKNIKLKKDDKSRTAFAQKAMEQILKYLTVKLINDTALFPDKTEYALQGIFFLFEYLLRNFNHY